MCQLRPTLENVRKGRKCQKSMATYQKEIEKIGGRKGPNGQVAGGFARWRRPQMIASGDGILSCGR
jgi:hypothetical protein